MRIKKVVLVCYKAMVTTAQDGGSVELSFVDFPAMEGLLLVQGVSEGVVAARRRYVLCFVFDIGILRT